MFKYRIHDARLGRFLSVDPLSAKFPYYSSYQFAANQPIHAVELEGLESSDDVSMYGHWMEEGMAEGDRPQEGDQSQKLSPSKRGTNWFVIAFNKVGEAFQTVENTVEKSIESTVEDGMQVLGYEFGTAGIPSASEEDWNMVKEHGDESQVFGGLEKEAKAMLDQTPKIVAKTTIEVAKASTSGLIIKKPTLTPETLLKTSKKLLKQPKGRSTLWERNGDYSDAVKLFKEMDLEGVTKIFNNKTGKEVGMMGKVRSDGRLIKVRNVSSDGSPTIEIVEGKKMKKIRFKGK